MLLTGVLLDLKTSVYLSVPLGSAGTPVSMIKVFWVVLCFSSGGRGQIKQKKKTVPQKVSIAKIPRAKKKYVTRVCGLATFGKSLVIFIILIFA